MIVGINHPVSACQIWETASCNSDDISNHPWELICDPSDSMIIGGMFNFIEIVNKDSSRPWSNWIAGSIFRNVKSGKILEIYESVKLITRNNKIVKKKYLMCRIVKPSDQLELKL